MSFFQGSFLLVPLSVRSTAVVPQDCFKSVINLEKSYKNFLKKKKEQAGVFPCQQHFLSSICPLAEKRLRAFLRQ